MTELLTSGLPSSRPRDTVGRAEIKPIHAQGEVKVNVGDGKPGNTAVFGSGGGVVMEFLSL